MILTSTATALRSSDERQNLSQRPPAPWSSHRWHYITIRNSLGRKLSRFQLKLWITLPLKKIMNPQAGLGIAFQGSRMRKIERGPDPMKRRADRQHQPITYQLSRTRKLQKIFDTILILVCIAHHYKRELQVKTRRGSRTDVSFMSGQGGDQDQTACGLDDTYVTYNAIPTYITIAITNRPHFNYQHFPTLPLPPAPYVESPLCQDNEGIKTRRELHVRTWRGSRPYVSFMSGHGGDQDQT
ncbi:unnamed protein product [Nesidiocoris tenuis]|uniref:Uncharacterized protein n=1 Tax=Nesidiocoris tenuis TaxID=355587 RepID=A0A6H5G6Y6_9HEMI|nr:unnamed protein product [Nesidiocoris tenuis]